MAKPPGSLESQTFKELQEFLRIGIQDSIDAVLTQSYQEDLITDDQLDELTNPMWPKNTRAKNFLRTVGRMIKKNPANLQSLRGILEQEPVHQDLVKRIGKCSLCLMVYSDTVDLATWYNLVSQARQMLSRYSPPLHQLPSPIKLKLAD